MDRLAVAGARIRTPMAMLGLLSILAGMVANAQPLTLVGLPLLVAGLALLFFLRPPTTPSRTLVSPVAGRWLAVNSPASKVPSHGTHAYGQSYAVDLLYDPEGAGMPSYGWWPLARRPTGFRSFGQPIRAPSDAVVVRATGWQRDHWSRTSWPALGWFFLEGMVREVTGPGRILGNHVVLRLGDGTYAVLAHLQRRSIAVRSGDRVRAGDVIARCGNSGNTTEPHLHLQVMDHRSPLLAAGVPFALSGVDLEDGEAPGLPGNEAHLVAPGHRGG